MRRALVMAGAVCLVICLADWLIVPLTAGRASAVPVLGPILAAFAGLSSLLALPGLVTITVLGLRPGHHTPPGAWFVLLATTFVGYAVAFTVLLDLWRRLSPRIIPPSAAPRRSPAEARDQSDETGEDPPLPSRALTRREALKRTARIGIAVGATGATGIGAYALLVEPRRFEVTHRQFPVRGLRRELDGLRVVHLTDLHLGPYIPLTYLRDAIAAANAARSDVVVLTGDYVHSRVPYIRPIAEALADLRAAIGVVATLGNHDWWADGAISQREFARVGLPLIDNTRRFVTPDRTLVATADEGLCLAGVGDYYEDEQRYADALDGVAPHVPRLLLSHNPDVAEDRDFRAACASGMRVDLMLSGHTHGGQIRLPGLGTPVLPSRYGQKYAAGLVQGPACPVFVNRGLGTAFMPLRFGVRPEVAVIDLVAAPEG